MRTYHEYVSQHKHIKKEPSKEIIRYAMQGNLYWRDGERKAFLNGLMLAVAFNDTLNYNYIVKMLNRLLNIK